jgi:hypothetical protein
MSSTTTVIGNVHVQRIEEDIRRLEEQIEELKIELCAWEAVISEEHAHFFDRESGNNMEARTDRD